MYDYHTHHCRCGHAEGTIRDYIQSAIEKGARQVGISDHSPIYHLSDDPHVLPKTAMAWGELPKYVEEATRLKSEYQGRIAVRLGIESDYVLGWDDHYRKLWKRYDLDYVLCSVHWIDDWNIFHGELPKGHTRESMFELYLESTIAAAESGVYDVIAHFDAIKTSGHMPPLSKFKARIRAALEAIAAADMAIELNTSGWRKSCNEQYPSRYVLTQAHQCGIPVVLGSDAHEPNLVTAGFDRALALLHDIGFDHIATFENRKRAMVPIEEAIRECTAS